MTKEEKKEFQQLIDSSLLNFWEKILEPVMATKEDIEMLSGQIDTVDRRLEAETTYRDRLEKRVVRVENKLSLPHSP